MNIRFGPAGNIAGSILESIPEVKAQGLNCQEVEFVHGVKMSLDKAKEAGALSFAHDVKLSIHCPYYINLCAKEKEKRESSMRHIFQSCERGHYLHAKYIVFHPGYYLDWGAEKTYALIKEAMLEMMTTIKKEKWDVLLAPETTGKGTQFGTVDELLKLRKEIGSTLCVDFAHIYARNNGVIDYPEVFRKLIAANLRELHCHFSGIEYGPKGEKKHLIMEEAFFLPLAKELKKNEKAFDEVSIICESPITYKDSLKMQKIWNNL